MSEDSVIESNNYTPISNSHYSVDLQIVDAMSFLELFYKDAYNKIIEEFPEFVTHYDIMFSNTSSSWFDVQAAGLPADWSNWLCDSIENTGLVIWEEGEPWGKVNNTEDVTI